MGRLVFAHPAYLWGLCALALPILVHLFNRRRPRPLAFGAIEFVLRSQQRRVRRLRLRQILLLGLRCLLIAGVALALARPSIEPRGSQAAVSRGPQATALVIDASLSMRYRRGSQTLFGRARNEALAALERLGPDEPATVSICAGNPPAPLPPTFDRVAMRRIIENARPTYVGSDLTACMASAARGLGESPVPGKRIVAFTDLAAHSIRLDAPPPLVPPPPGAPPGTQPVRPNVVVVDAAQGNDLPNVAVVATAVQPAPSLGARGYEVIATIANYSSSSVVGLPVALRIGQQTLAKGFVDVPPRGTAKKTLAAVLPAGTVAGRVEIARAEEEGLDEDDTQDFVVEVPRDVKVLVIDGSPSALRTRDEAFFVEAALAPARTGGRIAPTVLDAEAAVNAPLEGYDVILLLDVIAPPKAFAEKLRSLVAHRGVGVFISLGDHVDPDAYNEAFGNLLPRPLHLVKTAAETGAEQRKGDEKSDQAARFGVVEWTHPLFRVFTAADREGLLGARTFRYALLKPDPSGASRAILSYDDGAPALVEGQLGLGRVLLYTSTVSHAWTDWPVRVSFLPVLQQSVSWLAGALEEKAPPPSQVGNDRALIAPPGTRIAAVYGPDGVAVPLRREKAPAQAQDAASAQVLQPGLYRVQVQPATGAVRDEPSLGFVARLDPKESDLRRVDESELKAQLGGAGSAQVASTAQAAEGARGTPLWGTLFLLGVLALLGEGALTRR
ncbi:MAG TPA: BatA domain-containing protein [Myxococcales bacterium]|nr:BatA domain-containing protein [Myxococcales bacterium]